MGWGWTAACSAPIFAKNSQFFQKIFIIFTHFSNQEKTFYLQRPRPHPSARADSSRGDKNQRIPPRQHSAKKRMARQQSDELEKTKRELLVIRTSHSADADIRARDPGGTPDSRVN